MGHDRLLSAFSLSPHKINHTYGGGMGTGLTLYGYLDSGNGYKIRLLLAQLPRLYTYRELELDS